MRDLIPVMWCDECIVYDSKTRKHHTFKKDNKNKTSAYYAACLYYGEREVQDIVPTGLCDLSVTVA